MSKEHRSKVAGHAWSMRRSGFPNSTIKAAIRIHRVAIAQRSKS